MIDQKIKELRKKKGFTISELAKLAHVSKSYLSQIERGLQKNPSLNFLSKIAIPLNTSIEYLLKGESVCDLDDEWRGLIKKAMEEGIGKEDFMEYINFLKFQAWINDQNK